MSSVIDSVITVVAYHVEAQVTGSAITAVTIIMEHFTTADFTGPTPGASAKTLGSFCYCSTAVAAVRDPAASLATACSKQTKAASNSGATGTYSKAVVPRTRLYRTNSTAGRSPAAV